MHNLNSSPLERLGEVLPIFSLTIGNRTQQVKQAISEIKTTDPKLVNLSLYKLYNDSYNKALYGVFPDIDPTHPLWEKVQQFKLNTADFAAHKSYQQTKQIIDANSDNEIKQIVGKFNRYQSAEYNAIIARSRTAKQWSIFQEEKHLYPNMEWLPSRSANPRPEHQAYWGLILPMNDPFWSENQPGNLYGCKCDWKTTDADPTSEPDNIIPPNKGLEGNPYETGEIFSDNHPYFDNTPKADEKEVDHFLIKQIRDDNTKLAMSDLRNNNYTIDVEDKEHPLLFSRVGLKHMFHNTHPYQSLKDLSIPYLPEIIKNAELIEIKEAGKNEGLVRRYLYYKYTILDKDAYINIREMYNGDMIAYAITPNIK